jgi:hydrogenase maturation factor
VNIMNARVKVVSGSFKVVSQVDSDKIEQIAALLGLGDDDKAALKTGDGLVVVGPLAGSAA